MFRQKIYNVDEKKIKKQYSGEDMLQKYFVKKGVVFVSVKVLWIQKDENVVEIGPNAKSYFLQSTVVNQPMFVLNKLSGKEAPKGFYEKKLSMSDLFCSPTPNGKKPYDATVDNILFPVFLFGGLLIIAIIVIVSVKTCRLKNRKKKSYPRENG